MYLNMNEGFYKYCRKCKKEKLCTEFYRKSSSSDGYRSTCIECDRKKRVEEKIKKDFYV